MVVAVELLLAFVAAKPRRRRCGWGCGWYGSAEVVVAGRSGAGDCWGSRSCAAALKRWFMVFALVFILAASLSLSHSLTSSSNSLSLIDKHLS